MAYCTACGRELGPGARWCPDCGTPRGRTVRCHSCGNEFPRNLGKCHRCGATGAAAYGPKYTWGAVIAVLVLMLAFVGLCLFGWYQHTRQVEEQKHWFEELKRENESWRRQHGFDRQ